MRELKVNEITEVVGGAATAALLWSILVGASDGLNSFGRGLGAGFYDATH